MFYITNSEINALDIFAHVGESEIFQKEDFYAIKVSNHEYLPPNAEKVESLGEGWRKIR